MAYEKTPTDFRQAFADRVRQAREKKGWSQGKAGMALGLGTDNKEAQGKFSKYESRKSLMPHHLIPRYCIITGVSLDWLFTGTESGVRAVAPAPKSPGSKKEPARSRPSRAA